MFGSNPVASYRRSIVILTFSCTFAVTSVAFAQPNSHTPPGAYSQAEKDRSRAAFERAESYYEAALAKQDTDSAESKRLFRKAIETYEAAYAIVPWPVYHVNIAQTYRTLDELDTALTYYEKFLEAAPKHEAAPSVATTINEVKDQIQARKDAAALREQKRAQAERRAKRAAASTGRVMRVSGLVVAGLGLVSVGFGSKLGVDARSLSNDLSNKSGQWTNREIDAFDDFDVKKRNATILISVGVAAAALGVGMYYFGRRARASAERRLAEKYQATLVPVINDSVAGLVMAGVF